MPPEIEAGMNARGWKVSKDTSEQSLLTPRTPRPHPRFHLVMKAFDMFLAPDCRYSGNRV
jgi:hypothetical protein